MLAMAFYPQDGPCRFLHEYMEKYKNLPLTTGKAAEIWT